jgi:Cu(I)/Ag(I) efflux system membrane protein CusA/SilA
MRASAKRGLESICHRQFMAARDQWRRGMTYEKLIQEMDQKASVSRNLEYLDYTGRKSARHGIDGHQDSVRNEDPRPTLEGIQEAPARIQQILSSLPRPVRSLPSEFSQGSYLNVEVNRPEAARYGLTVSDIQEAVASGIGGMNVTENVEGRECYPPFGDGVDCFDFSHVLRHDRRAIAAMAHGL